MDFGIYPPELNSGRMYTGPGPGPMLAAAQAWAGLADELYTTIGGYQSVVAELTDGLWLGPSSAAMAAAAGSFVQWLGATAAQAEQTAAQAWAAVAAYEAAFAATVPPPEIAANRALLAALVATNLLGQNTPAIAATEALYAQMWAQDAVAMYDYAGSCAAAVVLTPFTTPQQNTDPGGTAGQAAAVSRAAAGDASGAMSAVPQLSPLALNPVELLDTLALLSVFVIGVSDLVTIFGLVPADVLTAADLPLNAFTTASGVLDDRTFSSWNGVEPWPGTGQAPVEPFVTPLANPPPGGIPAPRMFAAFGGANTVGTLTVPPKWTEPSHGLRPTALVTPLADANAAAELDAVNTWNQMAIGAMAAGQAAAQPPTGAQARTDARGAVRLAGRSEAAPAQGVEAVSAPRTVMTGVAAAIREIAAERAAGRLSEQEYKEEKKKLLEISFGE